MGDYRDLLGVRYVRHGRSVDEGLDCHGLVIEVLARNGIRFPDVGERASFTVTEKPEENCVVSLSFAGKYSHIGVCIGDGLMIHATERDGVVIEPLSHYRHNIRGFYRIDSD